MDAAIGIGQCRQELCLLVAEAGKICLHRTWHDDLSRVVGALGERRRHIHAADTVRVPVDAKVNAR